MSGLQTTTQRRFFDFSSLWRRRSAIASKRRHAQDVASARLAYDAAGNAEPEPTIGHARHGALRDDPPWAREER